MSSQVLALKYRPQRFEEVVGQETTVKILKNALTAKKFHHAYLFAGPRGIGKTTLARIFAKALNCEKGPQTEPCNDCVSCREIAAGNSLSVMEIDGASNTGVEDVRDLRERIRYLPAGGRYKIYIIDEVHMLSTAAFNALLKTLEEPPPHAIFLFATTEPQKIPSTVLSRVIRFDLRPIPVAKMVDRLKEIAKRESIQAEEGALYLIAREAEGGLRDGLSLLDQVVSFSGREVSSGDVEAVIGVSTRKFVIDLARAILEKDGSRVMAISRSAYAAGAELKRLSLDLLEYFRHLLVAKVSLDPVLFDLPKEDLDELVSLSKNLPEADIDHLFQVLQRGVTELLRSPLPKVYFDVLLLRLCHFESLRPLEEILKILSGGSTAMPLFNQAQRAVEGEAPPEAEGATRAPLMTKKSWPDFLNFLRGKKPQLYAMLCQGQLLKKEESEVVLEFPQQSIHLTLLQEEERTSLLRDCTREFFGRPLAIKYESGRGPTLVDEAIDIFGAKRT